MSLRSQVLPPAPGPPPLAPPPPIPNISPPRRAPSSPRSRPPANEVQWQSRETEDAIVWSMKSPQHIVSETQQDHERLLSRVTTSRRASLSSLSLNRFSLHLKKERPPPSPEPPVPPLKSSSKRKPLEVRATIGNSRGVQRRTSGVERRVSASRSSSLTPTSRGPAIGTVVKRPSRSPSGTPPLSPIHVPQSLANAPEPKLSGPSSPTLSKKRSFFRRVADRLTRSKTNLREEVQASAAQLASPLTNGLPDEPFSAPFQLSDGVELPVPLPSISYSPPSTSLHPTPTSARTRKAPPPCIKVPGSSLNPGTLVANGEGQFLDAESRSPSRIPLPPSPALSNVFAVSPRTATTSSGFQSTSPLATPTTPTQQVVAIPRVPRKSSSASALSELSRRGAILNPPDDRPPLPSPHGLNFPLPPITQLAAQWRGRSSSDGFSLKVEDTRSETTMSVHTCADPRTFARLDAEALNHATSRYAGSSSSWNRPKSHVSPEILRNQNTSTKNSRSGSRDSYTPGSRETWQSDSRPGSSSFSDQNEQSLSRSTRTFPRTDPHARADSHTLGNLLLNLQQSPPRGDKASYGHDSNALPPPSSFKPSSKLLQDKEKSQATEEEEVRLVNLKVSRWLAESPIASASSSPQQSISVSVSESSFGHAAGAFDAWRTALEAAEVGDDDQLMPEVEGLALEAEERGRKEESEGLDKKLGTEEKKATRRSRSLFGRRREKAEVTPAPSSPRSSKETKRRSLRFLSIHTETLPPSPALPLQSASPISPVNPRMHTRSILLETGDIIDPESRR